MTGRSWAFLTNHAHVLACLRHYPDVPLRVVADSVGITERAVLGIIADLDAAGIVTRERIGRHNRYTIVMEARMRHPLLHEARVGDLIDLLDIGDGVAPGVRDLTGGLRSARLRAGATEIERPA